MENKIDEYFTIIEKTAVYPQKVENFGLAYAVFGFMGEFMECAEKRMTHSLKDPEYLKEVGDVLWYAAAICKETGISLSEVILGRKDKSPKNYNPFENIKKFYRDGKVLDLPNMTLVLQDLIESLLRGYTDEEIFNILTLNYNKLIQRRENNTIHGDGDNR